MSAIAGVFSRRSTQRRPGEVARMLSMMSSRGPDGTHTWTQATVALGHGALHATPESVDEEMPLVDRRTGNVIVADVRLDNRPELLDRLGLARRDASTLGDGRLLLDAYREWGENCVDHLLGDFAFAIWNERCQELFLARDHFGAKPLTYHSSDHLFAFASDSRSVIALDDIADIVNRDRVIDFLIDVTEWIDTTSTFFANVQRLPPAHTLTISATEQRLRRYWHLREPEPLQLRSDAEYEEATREVLDLAVTCRLRGRHDVGVMLSGGIDSSAVAVAVSHHARPRTFSAIFEHDETTETAFIRAITAVVAAEATFVEPSQVGELCGDFLALQRTRESLFSSGPMVRSLLATARRHGCRSIVSGIFGDEVVEISPSSAMRVFLVDRDISALVSLVSSNGNLAAWAGHRGLARSAASVALEQSALFNRLVKGRRSRQSEARWRNLPGNGMLLLSPTEVERVRCRVEDVFARVAHADRPGSVRHRMFDGGYAAAGLERYDRTAAACSLESRSPFTDRRVVEFYQRLPATQLVMNGWSKSVLRRSVQHALPPQVVWNRAKPHLAREFQRPWLGDISAQFLQSLTSEHPLHEYLDVARLRQLALYNPLDRDSWLERCVELGIWLEANTSMSACAPAAMR